MSDHHFKPETLAIHAGQIPDAATGARALPIYQTTSFVFDSAEHAASLFNLQTFGNVYSRLSNPTVAALEERVAALEGGRAAVASASGMAAEAMALMTILQAGDHVVAAGALYGGSVTLLAVSLAKFGIETTFVDATQSDAFASAMRPNTRAVFAESLGNPSPVVLDIAAVTDVALAHGVPLVIDNTVPSLTVLITKSFSNAEATWTSWEVLRQQRSDTHSQARDRGWDVALRPLGCREVCNAWVGQAPGVVRSFFYPRSRRGVVAAGRARSRRRRCSGWHDDESPASPGPRSDPGRDPA